MAGLRIPLKQTMEQADSPVYGVKKGSPFGIVCVICYGALQTINTDKAPTFGPAIRRIEERREMPRRHGASTGKIPEQHCGSRSRQTQTANKSSARFQIKDIL